MTGLFGSAILEVAIGLVLLYLLLAVFVTTVNEWIAGLLRTRANTLKEGISELLDGQPLAANSTFLAEFYKHPLITTISPGGHHPSYLHARTFANVLLDLATPNQPGAITYDDLENGIKAWPDGDVKRTVLAVIQTSNRDLAAARQAIEDWFNATMDRVSGWYKREVQAMTVVLAVALVVVCNADTVRATRILWTTQAVRSAVLEQAKAKTPTDPKADGNVSPGLTEEQEHAIRPIVGWGDSTFQGTGPAWGARLLGWLLTAIAVSLGAPFWFDTLNKFMNIRSSGSSPDEQAKTS